MKAGAKAKGATERIRVGFIGCGRIADLQCLGYLEHPRAEIVAVCDLDAARAQRRAEEWGVPKGISNTRAQRSWLSATSTRRGHSDVLRSGAFPRSTPT
jgi:hypothetical protein